MDGPLLHTSGFIPAVFEARGLQRKDGGSFNTYIKVVVIVGSYIQPHSYKSSVE